MIYIMEGKYLPYMVIYGATKRSEVSVECNVIIQRRSRAERTKVMLLLMCCCYGYQCLVTSP